MNKLTLVALSLSLIVTGVNAAESISRDDVNKMNLTEIGPINVSSSDGLISSPTDLEERLSKLADEKGGKYYLIISSGEYGSNFEANAIVYK